MPLISVQQNRVALENLSGTFEAIDRLDKLIATYSEDKPGPAYCVFEGIGAGGTKVQIERSIMVTALTAQRQRLVTYLAGLGFDADN